jgi:hypothetical protein
VAKRLKRDVSMSQAIDSSVHVNSVTFLPRSTGCFSGEFIVESAPVQQKKNENLFEDSSPSAAGPDPVSRPQSAAGHGLSGLRAGAAGPLVGPHAGSPAHASAAGPAGRPTMLSPIFPASSTGECVAAAVASQLLSVWLNIYALLIVFGVTVKFYANVGNG